MSAGYLLSELGNALQKSMGHVGVPSLLSQQWRDAWDLMVVDPAEEADAVQDIVTNLIQALTHAREICRVYGHG